VPASSLAALGFCPPAKVSTELVVAAASTIAATAANVNITGIILVLITTPFRAEIFISGS
jgi:hypothetical protein